MAGGLSPFQLAAMTTGIFGADALRELDPPR
ncbi:hypothetical protein HDA32_005880 [Spinactinospora alkalitolerans]|uniref:Uncharacterized protein n=1 Tax=Spinactinospora alkalitolerans TaxID=687207 RepID=A0A852U9X1_9ACTN|nr:hypothetical protein [Spinactinospora alkalitolerans]